MLMSAKSRMKLLFDFRSVFKKILGSEDEFFLESRIFHAVCVVSLCVLLLNVPFNWFLDLYGLSAACLWLGPV